MTLTSTSRLFTSHLKYSHGVKLKADKVRDLEYLSKFVEPSYQSFFTDLFRAQEQIPTQVGSGDQGDDPDPNDPNTY